jgi:hypothetical protein
MDGWVALILAAGAVRAQSTAQIKAQPSPTVQAQISAPADSFICPAKLPVTEQGTPSADETAHADWHAPKVTSLHALAGITIYNGDIGDESASLAPDDEQQQGRHVTQTWQLKDYRDRNIWLQCRYRTTGATLAANIPVKIQKCVITFDLDAKGNITGTAALSCR